MWKAPGQRPRPGLCESPPRPPTPPPLAPSGLPPPLQQPEGSPTLPFLTRGAAPRHSLCLRTPGRLRGPTAEKGHGDRAGRVPRPGRVRRRRAAGASTCAPARPLQPRPRRARTAPRLPAPPAALTAARAAPRPRRLCRRRHPETEGEPPASASRRAAPPGTKETKPPLLPPPAAAAGSRGPRSAGSQSGLRTPGDSLAWGLPTSSAPLGQELPAGRCGGRCTSRDRASTPPSWGRPTLCGGQGQGGSGWGAQDPCPQASPAARPPSPPHRAPGAPSSSSVHLHPRAPFLPPHHPHPGLPNSQPLLPALAAGRAEKPSLRPVT